MRYMKDQQIFTYTAARSSLVPLKTNNLSDVASTSAALLNLGGQDSASIGGTDVNLVNLYNTAKS